MWTNEHTSLILEGKLYSKAELLSKATKISKSKSVEQWEKLFWGFIENWLDDKDTIIVHTSGSTGAPKPIKLQKQRMVNSALATGSFFKLKPKNKALLCLPSSYIAGKMMIVRAFVLDLDIYVSSPSKPMYNISEEIDFAAMVPIQVEKSIIESKTSLSQIQKLIIGGAPISPYLLEELKRIPTQCFATYGMTETITHIAVKSLNGDEEYYQALPNVNLSLDKRDCLIIDAKKVCEESVITNDIVKLLSSKTFKWLGRFDNVINSGGVKLFPESIEEKLSQVLSNRFFVASLPHEKLGEQLILIIESDTIKEEELIEVKSKIRQCVDKYENPKEIFFTPNFIETTTGKIMRKKTLELIN